jgi:hypothetical protein
MNYENIYRLTEASADYDYYFHQFDRALDEHEDSNGGLEYPISFRLGTSKNVNLNKDSVLALIEAYNKLANKAPEQYEPITSNDL